MNTILDQKRLVIWALSFLMVLSLASMTAGTALRNDKMDTPQLLRHAIKIDKNYLRNRVLDEDAEDQDADEGAEEDNEEDEDGNGDEDNGEDQANEDENDDAEEEANDEEEEDQNDDAEEEEDEDNNEEDAEEEAYEDDAVDEEEDNAEEEAYEDDAVDGEEDDAVEAEEEAYEDDAVEGEEDDAVQEEDDAVEEEEEEEEEDESDSSSEDQEPQIDFLSCIAMTIDPNVVDVEAMLQNGEINEDEAAEMELMYVTEMTSNLYTQESVVFFTYGYGLEDEDREMYMVSINDWIEASTGYDQTCEAVAEGLESSLEEYSSHVWYEGFNCMNDGTGFESQLFLDETCNTFSPNLTEEDIAKANSDLGTYMIETANDFIQNSQYCEDNEFCDEIFRNSVQPTTCEEGDDNKRNLATYQLEYDMASNIEDACPSIQTFLNIDEESEYQIDAIEELVLLWSNTKNGGQMSDRRSIIPGINDTWLYIVAGLLVILCIGTFLCGRTESPLIQKAPSDDTDDTKKEPLVKNMMAQAGEIEQNFSSIECTLSKKKRKKLESRSSEKRGNQTKRFREFLKKSLAKDANGTDTSTTKSVGSNTVAKNTPSKYTV